MLLLYFLGVLACLTATSSRMIDVLQNPKLPEKQLFLSRHVVTESGEFDGGVLVNENGIIEAVLRRDIINSLLSQNLNNFKIIDGGELALMAGVVDSHVHVNEPGRTSWEGYVTATQAAAVGGITTIIDMPLNSIPPTTTLDNLRVKAAMAKEEVFVDVGFWGGVVPGNEIELHDLIRAGVVGFKCFLTDSGVSEFPNVTPDDLTKVFAVLNGTDTVLAFHSEVSLNQTSPPCNGTGCPDPILYSTYLASKPDETELKAVELIASFLPQTDVHVHIVHVSAEGVVPILDRAREERIKSGYKGWRGGVTAETCNHYLTLSSDQIPPGHTEYKCSPPIRNNTNKQQLWEYIRTGKLDMVVSDHSPSVADLKGPDFMTAWGGISSVQFDLSLFWTEAKARGYSLSTASHYLSAGPARLAGLQDRKGALRAGLDADMIFFDPNGSFIVTPDVIRYKNKISPYMNRVLNGVVQRTYLRGQLIYDGDLVGGPKGQLLLKDDYETIKKSGSGMNKTVNLEMEQSIRRGESKNYTEVLQRQNYSMPDISAIISQITEQRHGHKVNESDINLTLEDNLGRELKMQILRNISTKFEKVTKNGDTVNALNSTKSSQTKVDVNVDVNDALLTPNKTDSAHDTTVNIKEVQKHKIFVNSHTSVASNLSLLFVTVATLFLIM